MSSDHMRHEVKRITELFESPCSEKVMKELRASAAEMAADFMEETSFERNIAYLRASSLPRFDWPLLAPRQSGKSISRSQEIDSEDYFDSFASMVLRDGGWGIDSLTDISLSDVHFQRRPRPNLSFHTSGLHSIFKIDVFFLQEPYSYMTRKSYVTAFNSFWYIRVNDGALVYEHELQYHDQVNNRAWKEVIRELKANNLWRRIYMKDWMKNVKSNEFSNGPDQSRGIVVVDRLKHVRQDMPRAHRDHLMEM